MQQKTRFTCLAKRACVSTNKQAQPDRLAGCFARLSCCLTTITRIMDEIPVVKNLPALYGILMGLSNDVKLREGI
jgi:hypothetical protein